MTLRKKSLFISVTTTIFFIVGIALIVNKVIMVKFQEVENQRVERNIRRVDAIIEDRITQIDKKLSDWTNWDDTYKFLTDRNQSYIESNLISESFGDIGVDEALFIDKTGDLVTSVLSTPSSDLTKSDVYQSFATGSALLKVDPMTKLKHGILKTDKGILLFSNREVYHSDGSGMPNGNVIFAKYFDESVINSMESMTQFSAKVYLWNDSRMSADFLQMKNAYESGYKSLRSILDDKIISGYQVIEDIYGKPQAIVRSDIQRDIVLQGRSSMNLLIILLTVAGIFIAMTNYWLLTGVVLKKVVSMANDVENLGKSGERGRLVLAKSNDEVDKLRLEINQLLDSLVFEKQKGESLVDVVDAIVTIINDKGEVVFINKKGVEILGYDKNEIINKNWVKNFVTDNDKERVKQNIQEVLSGEADKNAYIENEVIAKDKKVLVVGWRKSAFKDSNGKVTGVINIGEDVTLKKKEEAEREEYSRELERLNEVMVDRELKMIELKKELGKLK
jgi:PAS domain S-box-containing protein